MFIQLSFNFQLVFKQENQAIELIKKGEEDD